MGIALEIDLPGQKPFEIMNANGPFTKAQREELDQWIETRHRCQVAMGDFDDNLWDALSKQVRIWQCELHSGTLLDPVPLVPGAGCQH